MKIVHLNTLSQGGAANACTRLHDALRAQGTDSYVLMLSGEEQHSKNIFTFDTFLNPAVFSRLKKKQERQKYLQSWKVRLRGKPVELFSFPDSPWKIEDHPLIRDADVLHLHWVAGMIDVRRFFESVNKPVVWTLHDAWPFTGGFHYEKYFDARRFFRLSEQNLEVKKSAYTRKNITLVSPSRYVADLCESGGVFGHTAVHVIPNSVPGDFFSAADRQKARAKFQVTPNEKLWVFAAEELDYFRKGADLFFDAFSRWKKNVRVIVAGEQGRTRSADARINFIGRLPENRMAELLRAADVVIHSSREDNLPNLLLEANACGTPVLSTNAGGAKEIITDGENGWLVETNEIEKGFERAFSENLSREKIAAAAMEKYKPEVQAARFVSLYNSLR
jgi:glycosyltransferase involved in cell wall biosynthesis